MNKYKERLFDYSVQRHGDTYEVVHEFGLVCPECCSTNIDVNNENGDVNDNIEYNDYICKDCGCEFDVMVHEKLTERYQKIYDRLEASLAICFVLALISCAVFSVSFALHHNVIGFIFVGFSLAFFISCFIVDSIKNKLIRND